MKNNIVTKLLNLLETKGSNIQYGNENVTQLEHALQCAELAEKNNFSKEIITAALLHDIGHLLYDGEDPIHEGKDGYHENLGAEYLSTYYGEEVTRPIRAHVACKRYLSSVEDGYYDENYSDELQTDKHLSAGVFPSIFDNKYNDLKQSESQYIDSDTGKTICWTLISCVAFS